VVGHIFQHLPAIHIWHHDIEQHEVGRIAAQLVQHLLTAASNRDFQSVITHTQHLAQKLCSFWIIIHRQNVPHGMPGRLQGLLQIGACDGFDQVS